jgi:hypothetical protein
MRVSVYWSVGLRPCYRLVPVRKDRLKEQTAAGVWMSGLAHQSPEAGFTKSERKQKSDGCLRESMVETL